MQTPWSANTAIILRTLAELLSEQPEGRTLALHILEKTPDIGGDKGWLILHRARIALTIPDKETAVGALRKWISQNGNAPAVSGRMDVEQQLAAVDFMSQAGLTAEAATVFQRVEADGDLQSRSDLKKWAEELRNRLKRPADAK